VQAIGTEEVCRRISEMFNDGKQKAGFAKDFKLKSLVRSCFTTMFWYFKT